MEQAEKRSRSLSVADGAPGVEVLRLAPIVGIGICVICMVLFVVLGAETWRIGAVGVVMVGAVGMRIVAGRQLPTGLAPERARPFMIVLFLVQGLAIIVTGGVRSPFLTAVIPVSLLFAFVLGDRRLYATVVWLPLLTLFALYVCEVTGVAAPLLPSILDYSDPPVGHTLASTVLAAMPVMALIGGGVFALRIRGALDRARSAAVRLQHDNLSALRARNEEMHSLTGTLAHELKNPLTAIRGLSTLVRRHCDDGSRQAEQLDVLIEEVHRMSGIVEEFLNFSRPIGELQLRETRLEGFGQDLLLVHEEMAREHGVTLRLEHDPPGSTLRCDSRKLQQVLSNLLHNALEAAPRGSEVVVEIRQPAGSVVMAVSDEGPGLDPAIAERIFEPGVTGRADGSGLGLTIARAIVRQHGGELRLETAPGGGCRAVLEFPDAEPTQAAA